MNNLWLEFILDKFIEQNMPEARCCGSCQGGMSNPAICMFMCIGVTHERVYNWFTANKEQLQREWEDKQAYESAEYCRMMEETDGQ